MRARAGISLRTLSTTPGLSPSSSRHLLRHCLGQIPRDGAHIYSLDVGQGLGTGLSPASFPESAGWGSAPKWWLCSPRAKGDPRGDSAHLQGGREGTHKKGREEARRTDGCVVQQKGEIRLFWIYRGFDLAKGMLNQITTINVYELPTSN